MAKLTKESFIESLNEMTILEVNELVEAMKEAYGVDPSAMAVAAPAAGGSTDEATTVDVMLVSAGSTKIAVIKAIKEVTGAGLKDAKALADNGGAIKEGVTAEEGAELKAKFEEIGATIELK